MSSIESLKETARRHEQREEWRKALDLYGRAIARLEERESPDIGLFNRVGDLNTRIGRPEEAVEHYERAVDLYVESELPNNAIAVCKKIIRNLPGRYSAYLKMGRIRAIQGFLVDARANFLTYAERAQADGDLEEALRALGELADLAPDDPGVRIAIADRYVSNGQPDEALRQLAIGRSLLAAKGDVEGVARFDEKAAEIDPDADLASIEIGVAPSDPAPDAEADALEIEPTALGSSDDEPEAELEADFGEIDFGGEEEEAEEIEADFGEIDFGGGAVDEADEADELPLVTFDDDIDDEDEEDLGADLPLVTFEEEAAGDADAADAVVETAIEESAAEASDDPAELFEQLAAAAEQAPADVSRAQRMVEAAYRMNDDGAMARAYLALARALVRTDEPGKAKSVFQQVLSVDPDNEEAISGLAAVGGGSRQVQEVAASEDYVDLGAMILGDEEDEKTTRFTVAYEEPSGDEDADFKKMLSQFKAKVAENFDASDVKAHHDLGTAYKEMGLLDEAIEEFQQALRASSDHLPTYELLGQVFMDKGEPEAAVNTLKRALTKSDDVEDELVGIYYYLGRAHEDLGKTPEAIEFYDRVFALDINFADVTERLRTLR